MLTDVMVPVPVDTEGTIDLLNEEVAYEGQSQTYASKVRFTVPEGQELLSTDEVQLTIRKTVESYAGVQMQDDYVQTFDVEPRVRLMAIDSTLEIDQRTSWVEAAMKSGYFKPFLIVHYFLHLL